MRFKYLALSWLGLLWTAPVFAEVITFSPTKNVEATLVLEGSMLTVTVKNEAHNDSRTIDFQAENDLHVQINDFNFDGVKDFAVSQIDDGMGTLDYYRIFVYQPNSSSFEELQPDCGDGFVNLRIERKRKALISTCWEMNVPKQCVTRF
ncbi:XAC2610-related protein [Pseudomonas silensiensis]|uniref:XAC2610-related protein n=1 Tax=Pseudomonas silensiensis TaxID=2991049 RepID=UPI003D241292